MTSLRPMTALDERLRRQDGILSQEVQDQTVLLRPDDGGYYALDEAGAMIWELCDGHRSLDDVVTALCARFDAAREVVAADVLEFVGDLRRERLLVEAP